MELGDNNTVTEQIHTFTFETNNTYVPRNRFENNIYHALPNQLRKKLDNSDNIIKFRQFYYRLMMVLIILFFCIVVLTYNIQYIKYFFMSSIVNSPISWMYSPDLEDLETRSTKKASEFTLVFINTTDGLRELRKSSQFISDQILADKGINEKNITFDAVFKAHERLIKENDLECVCSPMYGQKYRFMSFNSTSNMIIHTINAVMTGPPSSMTRLDYALSKKPKGSLDGSDIRLLDSEYFILPHERKNTMMKFLESDSVLVGQEKPTYNLVTFDPMIDIQKIDHYNTYTVTILFPSYISINYTPWNRQYNPSKTSWMIIDDKSSACVETCLLLFEGISPFDISFHE